MILTEKEAAEKWCPQASGLNNFTSTRSCGDPDLPNWEHCIGSRCMLWEWVDHETESDYFATSQVDAAKAAGWAVDPNDLLPALGQTYMSRHRVARRGTCGLINRSQS